MYLFALSPIALAQTKSPAAGHWEGGITLPNDTQLEVGVDLDQDAQGSWRGDIDIPAQGARDIPLKEIAVAGRTVAFQISLGPGNPTFRGQLSEDGSTIAGNFDQGGNKLPFSIKRTGDARVPPVVTKPPLPEKFTGTWEGTLETPNGSLRLVLHLANTGGAASGTLDSPDQGASGIPISEITATDDTIRLVVAAVGGSYEAKLSEDGKALTGAWSQGGASFALAFAKK